MGRLSELRLHVNYELEMIPDPKMKTGAIAHLYGVSLAAVMLAKKRGLDPELSAMAAMLHDLAAYRNGSYEDHARKGAVLAREILQGLRLTSAEETDVICSAIERHSGKLTVDQPMDEVLKDADVIHHCMHDPSKPVKEEEKVRFERICKEFGLEFQ